MKKYIKILPIFILIMFVFNTFAAENEPTGCDIINQSFKINLLTTSLDVTRTVEDVVTAGAFTALTKTYGVNADQLVGCQATIIETIDESGKILSEVARQTGVSGSIDQSDVCGATDPEVCKSLINDQTEAQLSFGGYKPSSLRQASIRSSLLGMSNTVENFVNHEPLPINLAYFWNQSISKVPFVNKALAADDPAENMPVMQAAFFAWKFSRNISLALISIVLLYTGILIVMRKKVNPQLIVSVQYAIPKILIGIVLIVFSYAIGSLIAAVGWALFRSAPQIIWNEFTTLASGTVPSASLILIWIVTSLLIFGLGGGLALILLIVLISVAVIVMKIILYFKAFLIYIKMVISTVTAPLEMVLGTVPGSESRITDWFIRMAKYVITLFAMGAIIPITLTMALSVVISYSSGGNAEVGGWGILIATIAPLIIILFGFSVALGVEKKVDSLLFGATTKKR